MAHEQALMLMNNVMAQMQALGQSVINATKDGKVDPIEMVMLASQGTAIATIMITTVLRADAVVKEDMLFVLQNSVFMLPQ